MIRHREGQFGGGEGQLYWQAWDPDAPRAMLVLVHGFDDHSGRYAHVAEHFAAHGFVAYTFDQAGHGKSGGPRGHVSRFDQYVEDLDRFIAFAWTQHAGLKTFLLGHSQGGMVVLRYGLAHPERVHGIISSGAGLLVAMPTPAWKLALGKVLSNAAPTFSMANGIPIDRLTHDQQMLERTRRDPLRHGRATARWADEFFRAQKDTLNRAGYFDAPLLMLHGAADGIIAPDATRRFYEAARSTDKQMKLYDGMYHEILNEVGREQVLADIEQWLNAHL
jgi:alpha-beta hydrolase superfamily lysophospholipase